VALPADVILNVSARGGPTWQLPAVDGVDLTAPGVELAARGQMAKVPVLAGGTAEDLIPDSYNASCTLSGCSRADFVRAVTTIGFSTPQAAALANLYETDPRRPGQAPEEKWHFAIRHAGADAWSNCAARRTVRWAAAINGGRAHWYRWSYVARGPNGGGLAHHSVEQPFIFHVLRETALEEAGDGGLYHIAAGTDEVGFSETLVRAWTAMAARGDPSLPSGNLSWPPFLSSANGTALLIEGGGGAPPSFRVAADYMGAKCDLFDEIFFERLARRGVGGMVES